MKIFGNKFNNYIENFLEKYKNNANKCLQNLKMVIKSKQKFGEKI